MSRPAAAASPIVVDAAGGALAVATAEASTAFEPTVALAAGTGQARARVACVGPDDGPPGHDGMLVDPFGAVDTARLRVGRVSLPADEVLAAPLARAIEWGTRHGGSTAEPLVVLTPGHWGRGRGSVLVAAGRRLGVRVRPRGFPDGCVDALGAAAARWVVVVESGPRVAVVTLLRRDTGGREIVDRAVVPGSRAPAPAGPDSVVDRIAGAVAAIRARQRSSRSGSFEVLVRGDEADPVADALEDAGVAAFVVGDAELVAATVARLVALETSARRAAGGTGSGVRRVE